METKRKALGKGLEQLFNGENLDFNSLEQTIVESANQHDVLEIDLDEIRSNPYQPRKHFDKEALDELAESIKENGVIQPIIVKKSIKGYELVAGERRTKASRLAGLKTIPAIVRDFSDDQMMEIAILENIQREDLSPIEEAEAYEQIIKKSNLTQDELAKKFGKSRSHITNMLGLLRLPYKVRSDINEKKISMSHARVLSKLEDEILILNLADQVVHNNISVHELEDMVQNKDFKKVNAIAKKNYLDRPYASYENVLRDKIGTRVKITSKKIEIPFDSKKDLERILDIINVEID